MTDQTLLYLLRALIQSQRPNVCEVTVKGHHRKFHTRKIHIVKPHRRQGIIIYPYIRGPQIVSGTYVKPYCRRHKNK